MPRAIEVDPVIVVGYQPRSKFEELGEKSSTLKGTELQQELGLTLASTLKDETGLAMRSMGPAPARPVIRGLGGDRVVISEDGRKTVDLSSTSPDHAVTIEPFSVEKIEVIRGPRVLLHTSTTIGGVVNVIRNDIPEKQPSRFYGVLGSYTETANRGYLGSLSAEIPLDKFVVKGEFNRRNSRDIRTPVGTLENSDADNLDFGVGGSFINDFGFIGYAYRQFNLDYGIPGGFIGGHPNGVDIEMYKKRHNARAKYDIDSGFLREIEIDLSRVYYRHKELESNGLIGSEFEIVDYSGRIDVNHDDAGIFSYGAVGLSMEHRDYTVGGYVFNPPSISVNTSMFVYEIIESGRFNFEFGGRFNYDRISPDHEKPYASIGHVRERVFSTFSMSVSCLYEISEQSSVGVNVSKSSRVPTIEELFSEGPHLAAYSYETGNPELDAETGFGTEFFYYYKDNIAFFGLNIFHNDLEDYIIPRNTGRINYATFLPVYASSGVSARIYGIESQVEIDVTGKVTAYGSLSCTRGIFKDTDKPLPRIPPLKGSVGVKHKWPNITFGVESQMAAGQYDVDEFEEPTAGYMLLNSYLQYHRPVGDFIHSLSLSVDNIFDTEYRNHLSRIKSIIPEPGRNFRITYKLFYN
ncbi:MAG: TonB-dependent receptor [candidate division Zixibacteria bacterium]|nr:TonB-dependent receptor [candidate division Zixibacteria bacterium]